jgi:hypothetical protein
VVEADLTGAADWLTGIAADRPTVIVADGLQAVLTGPAFEALVRAVTTHFNHGELVFNACHPLALRRGGQLPVLRQVKVPQASCPDEISGSGSHGPGLTRTKSGTRADKFSDSPVHPARGGFVDPREPEGWGAAVALVEEILLSRVPEVALYPWPMRVLPVGHPAQSHR